MKTAVIQIGAGKDKKGNIDKAICYVERACKAKAKFVLLPEVFIYRGRLDQKAKNDVAERIPGQISEVFCRLAKKYSVHILMGSIYEKSNHAQKVYNTSILINSKGHITGKYRKINLFEAVIGRKKVSESTTFLPGKKPVLSKVGKFNVGLSVCYDLRFSNLYKNYYKMGAHILCIPSAFTKITGKAHWEVLLRARAIENFCYVLAPNQIGKDDRGIEYYGHSMIIDPWGKVIKQAPGDKETIIYGTLDRQTLMEKRKMIAIG